MQKAPAIFQEGEAVAMRPRIWGNMFGPGQQLAEQSPLSATDDAVLGEAACDGRDDVNDFGLEGESSGGSDTEDDRDHQDGLLGSAEDSKAGGWKSAKRKPTKHSFMSNGTKRTGMLSSAYDDDEEHEDFENQSCWCRRWRRGEERCCSGDTFAHICYICIFVMFLIMFPFFLKWMVHAPVPQEFWNKDFEKFPLIEDWKFVQDKIGTGYNISMSAIPTTWSGCNHSCGRGLGNLRGSSDMNFNVDIMLNAPGFKHTAYPVLLASNDFDKWWVAADRRHAVPQAFFASDTTESGLTHRHVTDKCSRPPKLSPEGLLLPVAHFTSSPTYLLVCVTWDSRSVEWHRGHQNMNRSEVGLYCDSVGGSCGWPCGSSPRDSLQLPGCHAGKLLVNETVGQVANMNIDGATFQGSVSLRPCIAKPGSERCITSNLPMSRWPCQKCRNLKMMLGENRSLFYESLPQLEVLLQNVDIEALPQKAIVPHAYILYSSLNEDGSGPAGMSPNGSWEKVYDFDIFPPPKLVSDIEEVVDRMEDEEVETTPAPSRTLELDRSTMELAEQNRLTMQPSWCFGKRGPLYLVACAANSSTYGHDGFTEFLPGQEVAGPPFNDRCLVVSGRCAYACMENQPVLEYCDAAGMIPERLIDGRDKQVESRKNDAFAVHMFIWTLLFGFAVKMLAYFPGLFTSYSRAKFYTPAQTKSLKYIAVCTPSRDESKACVLRNLVGSISSRPEHCKCPFHVLLTDEGHRHPQKIVLRVLVSIVNAVPDVCMNPYNAQRPERTGFKTDNLKCFMKQWVADTNKFRLEDCNTHKMVDKLEALKRKKDSLESDVTDDEAKAMKADAERIKEIEAKMKEIESRIDTLCGLKALRELQQRKGWPKCDPSAADFCPMRKLEDALLQMRRELTVGETKFDGTAHMSNGELPKPAHLDDCEEHCCAQHDVLIHLHYIARAKPDEDERTIRAQHVARGVWCYKLPKTAERRNAKKWLEWRKNAQVYHYGDHPNNKFLVPLRTSRGKAGGLNFAENYLFEFSRDLEDNRSHMDALRFKYGMFSIADARHQFQPDFFNETLPYFFQKNSVDGAETMLNTRVAFTQCPQYFQEMPDDNDYLDVNNSNFFRLGCMLRNCCGGVSSCGTNGTWLIRDRRAGIKGLDSVWELDNEEEMDQGFTQVTERRFFQESCKVEDAASSLDRVVKGKYSQYINMRLSYGMAQEATDYLASVQRWSEGGVVLSLQTLLGRDEGVHMIWVALLLWIAFVASLGLLVYGKGINAIVQSFFGILNIDDLILDMGRGSARKIVQALVRRHNLPLEWVPDYEEMFFDLGQWLALLVLAIMLLWFVTLVSHFCHSFTCCGRRKEQRRTRFPTSLAQWARLFITVDNLTYFLWFWTAFFVVGFNYYTAFFEKGFDFDPQAMLILSCILQVLSWTLIIASCLRSRISQSMASNEVFFLTLSNIWRTTQMFYITAPLTVYSILMGISDFVRNRSYGEDISYWANGGRGKTAKSIVQYWTLFLVVGVPVTWICFLAGVVGKGNAFPSLLACSFIGLDALHPCAYLWLGNTYEPLQLMRDKLENPGLFTQLAFALKVWCQKLCSPIWYRNCLRAVLFSSASSSFITGVGPLQHVLFPVLSLWFPQLGLNAALNLLAGLGR